jgi:hypothetical protein
LTTAATRYTDPRAHELRAEYLAAFSGEEIPVPVESIADDLLGLRIEERDLGECSGMLIPCERMIIVNAAEATNGDVPTRRHRFTIAHELGHWICHAQQDVGEEVPTFCRSRDLSEDADRDLEREANVFGAELLMPGPSVKASWDRCHDTNECAYLFAVSPVAMAWKLFNLGLSPSPTMSAKSSQHP